MATDERRGVLFALACYVAWGFFPLYFHLLDNVSSLDILANRVLWSLLVVVILLTARRNWRWLGGALHDRHTVTTFIGAAVFLSANWYIYIWAVTHNFVVEASLGYFLNPLVSVLFAVVFLHERQRSLQWAAIAIAALGVLVVALAYARIPWIALALAGTFSSYALFKKRARINALEGMALETGFMAVPALIVLIYLQATGVGAWGNVPLQTELLLIGTGLVTVFPLYWFALAARRIPMSLLGLLQYVSPTISFLIGILVFHEPFDQAKLIGFCVIWVALGLYWAEGVLHRNRVASLPQTAR